MLLGELKAGIPFLFAPLHRPYVADVSLPAVVGYIATMLYNPNNVSWEGFAGHDLARDRGGARPGRDAGLWPHAPGLADTWGHITSGGTLANIESIWMAKAVKFLPIAVRQAAADLGLTAWWLDPVRGSCRG